MTHGSIIRAVADYVWKAIGSTGKIILGDAPQADASFESIVSLLGLNTIRDFYRSKGLSFEVLDLRRQACRVRNEVIVERQELAGDPMGAIVFDLGADSEFADHQGAGHYYGADYDTRQRQSSSLPWTSPILNRGERDSVRRHLQSAEDEDS